MLFGLKYVCVYENINIVSKYRTLLSGNISRYQIFNNLTDSLREMLSGVFMAWKRFMTDYEIPESSSVFLCLESHYTIFVNKRYLYTVEHRFQY
jgi:hypothetical protein